MRLPVSSDQLLCQLLCTAALHDLAVAVKAFAAAAAGACDAWSGNDVIMVSSCADNSLPVMSVMIVQLTTFRQCDVIRRDVYVLDGMLRSYQTLTQLLKQT